MAIRLPEPPGENASDIERSQWMKILYEFVRGLAKTSGDEDSSIGAGETYHGVTALTAPRTKTLANSKSYQDTDKIIVQDESGDAGTHTITVAVEAGDTLNGTTTITANHGKLEITKRGDGQFYSA